MSEPQRKKVPEWINWGNWLNQMPATDAAWLIDNRVEYLDHTASVLVLSGPRDIPSDTVLKACGSFDDTGFVSLGYFFPRTKWFRYPDFLEGRLWRAARYATLATHGNWCRACGRRPPDVGLHVDHIKPRSKFPELALDMANLQVLCRDCNGGKGADDQTNWLTYAPPPRGLQ